MKRLLLLSVLALSACAPSSTSTQATTATLTLDAGALTLFNPGPGPLTEAVLRVDGPGLILGAPCAARAPNVYGCVLGTVAEGASVTLKPIPDPAGRLGTICDAAANFYQGAGVLFRRVELRCGGKP